MAVAKNPEPWPLIEHGPRAGESESASNAASGRSRTWVMEQSSTGARIARRWDPESPARTRTRPLHLSRFRSPLEPGCQLGPYKLLERLGRGAQGDVWKALRREPFVEFVALKVLKPSLAHNPARMAQFRREAERGIRLAGPSLLTVNELDSVDGYHFMTMPYIEGITLREVLKCRLARLFSAVGQEIHQLVILEEPEYLRVMARILAKATRALAHAHRQRIAHRDIKPANILLDSQRADGVYLCDFGLGRDLAIATTEQMRDGAGTPMYMAPERLLRATADEVRCDIYSMGVTLFEALTLGRPFRVPDYVTLQTLPAYLATAQPRRPREIQPEFPEEYEAIILKAMARNPADRYESADQLAEALDQVDSHVPVRYGRKPVDGPHSTHPRRPHVVARHAPVSVVDSRSIPADLRTARPIPAHGPQSDDPEHFSDPPDD